MARRKFARLKALMYEREFTQEDAARALGRGMAYVSRRMNGHEPFNFEDARVLGGLLEIPRAQWVDYFSEETK